MMQIISISDARKNFARIVQKVKETKEPMVIVQDSSPSVVIYPYDELLNEVERRKQQFQTKFNSLLEEGKQIGKEYLENKGIKKELSEDEIYQLIKDA